MTEGRPETNAPVPPGAGKPSGKGTPETAARLRIPWLFLLFAAMGLVAVWLVSGRTVDFRVLAKAKPLPLCVALALGIGVIGIDAFRLQVLVLLGRTRIPFAEAVRTVLVYGFVAAITPTSLGGEVSMIWLLHRRGMSPGAATAVTGIRTILPLVGFLLLMPAVAIARPAEFRGFLGTAAPVAAIGCAVLVALVGLLLAGRQALKSHARGAATADGHRPRRAEFIRRALLWVETAAHDCWNLLASAFVQRPLVLVFAAALTVVHVIGYLAIVPLCAAAFGVPVSFWHAATGAALVELITVLIPLPGGSGAAEAGIATVLKTAAPNAPGAAVLWATILWRLIATHLRVFSGGVLMGHAMHDARQAASHQPA